MCENYRFTCDIFKTIIYLKLYYIFLINIGFSAHLWGAYAILLVRGPSSVVRRPLSVVRRVSSVSTTTTRNNEDIKSIFSANLYHVPGSCLQGIGGAQNHKIIKNHKIMA